MTNTQEQARELEPCPFCNTSLTALMEDWRHPRNDCLISGFNIDAGEIEAWNTRALQPALAERERVVEVLAPFAKMADAFDYWMPEQMPGMEYPTQSCDLKFALEDCPNAVGELTEQDFRAARELLLSLQGGLQDQEQEGRQP